MPACLPKMRLIAGALLTVMYIIPCFGQGGEPSSRLKEADSDYKAGVAAMGVTIYLSLTMVKMHCIATMAIERSQMSPNSRG